MIVITIKSIHIFMSILTFFWTKVGILILNSREDSHRSSHLLNLVVNILCSLLADLLERIKKRIIYTAPLMICIRIIFYLFDNLSGGIACSCYVDMESKEAEKR